MAVDNATVEAFRQAIHARYAQSLPVVTAVFGKLSSPDVKLGIDVVIAFTATPKEGRARRG